MDYFDQLPDPLILHIFNYVSDIRTLARCRAVSPRFHSLVPHSDSLLLRVDRVLFESELPLDSLLLLLSFLKTLFRSLLSPEPFPHPGTGHVPSSPARILSGFHRVRELHIELPAGESRLRKGTLVRYKAVFGGSLKSCVILGFGGEAGGGFAEGLKERVAWVISVLIAASVRHAYVAREVVGQHKHLVRLSLRDRDGEGEVVMDERGLAECREAAPAPERSGGGAVVPSVRMRTRQQKAVEVGVGVGAGLCLDGATLVVVRPSSSPPSNDEEDAELAREAFGSEGGGGLYGNAVEALLKTRSYMLEMNSL